MTGGEVGSLLIGLLFGASAVFLQALRERNEARTKHQNEVSELKQEIEFKEDFERAYSRDIANSARDNASLRAELKQKSDSIQAMVTASRRICDERDSIQGKWLALSASLEQERGVSTRLGVELCDRNKQIESLQDRLDQFAGEPDSRIKKLRDRITSLENSIDKMAAHGNGVAYAVKLSKESENAVDHGDSIPRAVVVDCPSWIDTKPYGEPAEYQTGPGDSPNIKPKFAIGFSGEVSRVG